MRLNESRCSVIFPSNQTYDFYLADNETGAVLLLKMVVGNGNKNKI